MTLEYKSIYILSMQYIYLKHPFKQHWRHIPFPLFESLMRKSVVFSNGVRISKNLGLQSRSKIYTATKMK